MKTTAARVLAPAVLAALSSWAAAHDPVYLFSDTTLRYKYRMSSAAAPGCAAGAQFAAPSRVEAVAEDCRREAARAIVEEFRRGCPESYGTCDVPRREMKLDRAGARRVLLETCGFFILSWQPACFEAAVGAIDDQAAGGGGFQALLARCQGSAGQPGGVGYCLKTALEAER